MHHEGERAVQVNAGVTLDSWGSARVKAVIPPVAAQFLAAQRMVVIGAADDDGALWASPLAGPAGFITAPTDRTIIVDRLPAADDPLAGLFDTERDLGMIAVEPASGRRMRANGQGRREQDRLVVQTEQVYSNCRRYIQIRYPTGDGPPVRTVRRSAGLTAEQQRWIAAADTFFVTTQAAGLGADTSHRGGNPGFVTVVDQRQLAWPDYPGNLMYMTLGNIALDPRCGLLFADWEQGHTLQLTGRARTDWDPDRAAMIPGAQRMVDFEVDQVVQVDGGLGLRWSFGGYSRFNPS
jgi:hypothetical protein